MDEQVAERGRGRRFRLVAGLISVLVLTGCYRVNVSIDVADDGSGEASVVMGINPDSMLDLLGPMAEALGDEAEGEFGRDALCGADSMEETFGMVPDGVTVEPYDEDGYCGQRRTIQFAAGDDIGDAIGTLMDDDTSADDGQLVIEETADGGWRFEATGVTEPVSTEDAPDELFDPAMLETLLGEAEMSFEVTLPGTPVDSNATSVDGGTFRWDIDIADPVDEMFATTGPDGSGSGTPAWIWIVAVVVVAAAIAALLLFRNRRGGGPPAAATAPNSSFAPPAAPNQPPVAPSAAPNQPPVAPPAAPNPPMPPPPPPTDP